MSALIIKIVLEAIFASIASVGFAMVFNVPKHTLIYCAFGGAITYITKIGRASCRERVSRTV